MTDGMLCMSPAFYSYNAVLRLYQVPAVGQSTAQTQRPEIATSLDA